MKRSRLNNMQMGFMRRDQIYQAVIVDLYLLGAITKEVAEALTDTVISDAIKLPPAVEAVIQK